MVGFGSFERNLEVAFVAIFSALTFVLFFLLLGANGVVVGNDSAIHLQNALMYLSTGKIPISDIAWYTPLYHIVLDTFIAFTGITDIGQLLVLMNAVTALVNVFLVLSAYLVAAKFFSKKTGALAAGLLLLCFPLFELNAWGGYTTVLALAFMMLAFLYLASPAKGTGYTLIAFIFAFSVVLSHQLATFLAVFILPPFIVAVLVKSRGHYPKALIAALLGGAVAFSIYYLIPILPYLGDLINIIFFQLTLYKYQIAAVSGQAFVINFGFVFFFAFAGLVIGFFELRKRKTLSFYLLLATAFFVTLFFSQSYLVGIYLPYQRFIYYLLPPLAILAGVTVSFLIDRVLISYFNNRKGWQRYLLKLLSVAIICSMVVVMAVRFDTVSGKISESTIFYSTSDVSAYKAGLWLRENYPNPDTKVVVMEQPGQWFGLYAGKTVIAQTSPVVEWNVNATSVLDLSYELQHPLTMLRVYELNSNITEEDYVSVNMVWMRIAYFAANSATISFRDQHDTAYNYALSDVNRTVTIDETGYPRSITTKYIGDAFTLTQNISASNDSYPLTVTWQFSALHEDLSDVKLYLNYYFDSLFSFSNAYVPKTLNWENPWNNFTRGEDGWAVTTFSEANLAEDKCISVYSEKNQTAFGIKFDEVPTLGSVGVLSSRNIDAIRFEYQLGEVHAYSTVSKAYQLLTFSQSSIPQLTNLTDINTLFNYKTAEQINLECRDFISIAQNNNIGFVVYNAKSFNQNLLNSKWLQLIYSNDKYIICKISSNHTSPTP